MFWAVLQETTQPQPVNTVPLRIGALIGIVIIIFIIILRRKKKKTKVEDEF
jgi:hypothetical protein